MLSQDWFIARVLSILTTTQMRKKSELSVREATKRVYDESPTIFHFRCFPLESTDAVRPYVLHGWYDSTEAEGVEGGR